MTKGGTHILAISPSSRALGLALADKLGLRDTEMISLHEHKDKSKAKKVVKSHIHHVLKHCKPDLIVIEKVDAKRMNSFVQATIEIIQQMAKQTGLAKPTFAKRRDAALHHIQCWERNIRLCLRRLTPCFAKDCPKLAFCQPPESPLRHEWDRTWGQAIAACTIASYASHHYF